MDLHRHLRSLALLILVLATYFSALQARHHKIRHARQKKIVNNAKFVPVYYVVLDERPDLGPWGEWSAPGSCSRSCGGGVAFQSRNCRPGSTCQGPAKRYFSCNTMHCPPGSKDFRSEQCSKSDTLEFERSLHKWIPYTKGANNCELNCLPRGKLLDVFTKKVIDGTRCNDETLDVCVEGRCMPVGCDLFLGSSLREDKCRNCGGDNSGCITVSKIISFETDLSDAQRGYNDLLLIPAGATNIFVRELKHAENYLAIRNENNTYYLNGNFIIDDPKDFHFAGTVFHYERQPEGILLGSAVIRALGPTNESLYIALLYQEDRRGEGIEYEYSFSNKEVQSGDPDNFYWVTHDFSECSAPCGGGSHNRKLGCAKKSDNSAVSLRFCNPVGRPATTQGCNEHPCDPEWFISSWSNCTEPCKGGMQFRQVYCLQKISNTSLTVIEDDVCVKKLGEKPSATHNQPCNKECEEGKQYRKVTCSDTSDSTAKTTESTTISSEATTPKSEPTSSQMVHPVTTPVEKPGVCPTVEEADNCTHTCGEDADCGGGDKCCYNGCAYQCLNPNAVDVTPQAPEPVPRTPPDGRVDQAVIVNKEPVVRVNINSSALLYCHAMGWPRPTITWWRSDSLLPFSSKKYEQRRDFSLFIASVTYEDLGAYTCQAYNGLGRAALWTITLQGYKPPDSVFSGSETFYQFLVEPEVVRPPTVRPRIPMPLPEPTQIITELQIHPDCTDSPYFGKCKLIVQAKYCSHKYYSRFCCRSCTKDGQLPLDGIHLYGGSSRKRRY